MDNIKDLEQRLKLLSIERILVVDDTAKNVEAAKAYFKGYTSIAVDYSSRASEAKMMIEDAYAAKKYDLVLSDLEMQTPSSGLEVTQCAFAHQAMAAIVTGHNYGLPRDAPHGPSTTLMMGMYMMSVTGKKESPAVWEGLVGRAVDYMEKEGNPLLCALKRYHTYVGKPSEEGGRIANSQYVNAGHDPR